MDQAESRDLTAAERARCVYQAGLEARYCVAGQVFRLRGNSGEVFQRFDELYGPLRVEASGPPGPTLYFHFLSTPAGGRLHACSATQGISTTYPAALRWPAAVIGRLVLGELRTHYPIHAAAVVRAGRAVILAGASGMGKSTLATHLGRRGFSVLSDEMALLHRATGRIAAFPIRMGLREGPARRLVDDLATLDLDFDGDRKKLVDPRDLADFSAEADFPLHAVVLLTQRLGEDVITVRQRGRRADVVLAGWGGELARAVAARPEWKVISVEPDGPHHRIRLDVADLGHAVAVLRDLATQHGASLVRMLYEDLDTPDFRSDAERQILRPAAGVLEIMKKIPAYVRERAIREDVDGKASNLVAELARLLQSASFYKLTPGRIESMVAHVEQIA